MIIGILTVLFAVFIFVTGMKLIFSKEKHTVSGESEHNKQSYYLKVECSMNGGKFPEIKTLVRRCDSMDANMDIIYSDYFSISTEESLNDETAIRLIEQEKQKAERFIRIYLKIHKGGAYTPVKND